MNMEEIKQIIAEAFEREEKERKENGEEEEKKTKNSSLQGIHM